MSTRAFGPIVCDIDGVKLYSFCKYEYFLLLFIFIKNNNLGDRFLQYQEMNCANILNIDMYL